MTEATQTANPTDAREASKSRVQTQDTILATLTPTEAAKEPPAKADEPNKDEGDKPKKSAQERIQELAAKRKEAEADAAAERRRANELEAQVRVLSAKAAPIGEEPRPIRSQFTSDEAYDDALLKWGATRALAERERADAQARAEAEQAEIAAAWSKREKSVMKRIPDYAEVIGGSDISINGFVTQALLESEMGPEITYFLAVNPDEAKRLNAMKPIALIREVAKLERELAELDDEAPPKAAKESPDKPQKSKAPPPIEPVKSVPSSSGASASNFEEYKRRRLAAK